MIKMHTRRFAAGPWQFTLRALLGAVLVVALSFSACKTYLWWRYPYGPSHCCDKQLSFSLHSYARAHGGQFPSGEATPEASLSLLYPEYSDANTLRGKTVPLEVVAAVLDRGERLSPETCGWHYVEGLTTNDDGRIAIFWDKAGLSHNGERLREGGHIVMFLAGFPEHVPESRWAEFVAEQKRLLSQRPAAAGKGPQRPAISPNKPGD